MPAIETERWRAAGGQRARGQRRPPITPSRPRSPTGAVSVAAGECQRCAELANRSHTRGTSSSTCEGHVAALRSESAATLADRVTGSAEFQREHRRFRGTKAIAILGRGAGCRSGRSPPGVGQMPRRTQRARVHEPEPAAEALEPESGGEDPGEQHLARG